ncbi:serine/threonine-protein kinase [Tautonia sociabilis]|uniref:Protein kinase domain-containing protein n=1 Tax=Tautonia sociabilis TaxID=2080755 RepID=A0A432MP55_9BACT|nr:serine/threonine-protein kinase [Tautonia sociabilis]RUL88875.1 hypothetical protein TsocGM_04500 [Tautonia sociabilis]
MTEETIGRPDVEPDRFAELRTLWLRQGGTPSSLAGLVKSDLRRRFAEGQRPAIADYLEALPDLGADSERMLSLIYEEFCLREEAGEAPDPDSFCERYAPWRDSLASQLNYHRMLSQAVGVPPGTPPRYPEPGEHFLRFRLRSVLGQGGAARVFLADDEELGGRLSALKISSDRGEEPSIMGRLQHPHIMPVFNVVRDEETGLRGLCMPYRPGRPLDQVIRRMEKIPPARRSARTLLEAAAPEDLSVKVEWPGFPRRGSYVDACCWLGAALADALGHAHSRGIMHRDVKPANILLSATEGPQLLDFNLAHDPNAPDRAESALRGGTLPYMAPEQLEAFKDPDRWKEVGPSADLYALGLVLRELITGDRPEAPPPDLPLPRAINDLLAARVDGWPPVRSANPQASHALDSVLRRCLAYHPADRYRSASELSDDLRAVLSRRPMLHEHNPSRRERIRFWFCRHRIGLAVSAALALGTVAMVLVNRETVADSNRYVSLGRVAFAKSENSDGAEKHQWIVESKTAFHRALELDRTNVRAYLGMGIIANAEGNHAAAIRYLSRALQLVQAPQNLSPFELAELHFTLAQARVGIALQDHSQVEPMIGLALEGLDIAAREMARADSDGRNADPDPVRSAPDSRIADPDRVRRNASFESLKAEIALWRVRALVHLAAVSPTSFMERVELYENALQLIDPYRDLLRREELGMVKKLENLVGQRAGTARESSDLLDGLERPGSP